MKLEQIRQAIEVYNAGSINRAAQGLYLAQSSLSASIKSLERELGRDIFIRTPSGISLTDFGAEFIAHGREILRHMDAIEQSACIAGEEPLSLRVAVYYLFFASHLFTDLCNRHRGESVLLHYAEEVRSAVASSVAGGPGEIAADALGSPTVVTYAEPHPLFSALDDEIFRRIRPGNFITVSDRGTLIQLLSQTPAVHLSVCPSSIGDDFFPGIRRLRLRGAGFSFEIGFLKRRGHTLGPLAREYLQSVRQLLAE